jgi:hypothetical protein
MSVIYKLNPTEPNNPEVLLLGGAGSINLNTLKKRVTRRFLDLAETVESSDSTLSWSNVLYRTENNVLNDLRTIVEAHTELEKLRAAGGIKSRGIKKA